MFSAMPTVEIINFDLERNFHLRSSEGVKFGMRNLMVFNIDKGKEEILDSYGSTVFEMLTDAWAHSNGDFLFSPEEEQKAILQFVGIIKIDQFVSPKACDVIVISKHSVPGTKVFKILKKYYDSCKSVVERLIKFKDERESKFDVFHLKNESVKNELLPHQFSLLKKLVELSGRALKMIKRFPKHYGMFQKCGTGKTHTILALISAFSQSGRSICFACCHLL